MKKSLLPLILLIATVIRIACFISFQDTPVIQVPIIDSEYYHQTASDIISGDSGDGDVFFMAPLYPFILSLFYRILGVNPQVAVIFQIIAGVILVYLVYLIGIRLFNRKVALLAALVATLYKPFIYYEEVLLTATLILILNAFVILLLLSDRRRALSDLSAGILIGLSALARPNILLFLALLVVYFLLKLNRSQVKRAVFVLLGTVVILLPVAFRNYQISGHWVITTAGAGMNFFAGNNSQAEGIYWEAPFIRSAEPEFENRDYQLEASRLAGRDLDIVETSRFWLRQGLTFIYSEPLIYLKLLLRKFFLFFHRTEIPNNLSIYAGQHFSSLLRIIPFTFGIIAPLGMAFWFISFRRIKIKVVHIYGLTYLIATLAFFAASEYRLPLLLVLIPLSCAGFFQIIDYIKDAQWKNASALILFVVLFALVINMPTRFTAHLTSPRMDFFNLGSVLLKTNQYEEAASMLQVALITDPDFAEAHNALGDCYHALALRQQAIEEFQRAGLNPQLEMQLLDAENLLSEAEILAMQNRFGESLLIYEEAVSIHPEPPAFAYFNMAYVNLQLGDTSRALDELTLASLADPDEPRVPYMYGLIYENRNDWDEALQHFLHAMELNPRFHYARAHAALASLELGDLDSAARLIEPLAGKNTSDPELTGLVEHISYRVGY
ncbi:hypothetical protein CEE37_03360 [candidate division LCP-89 bacterium B3_LCP]|uniref:Glycosyltransferase RgtA/B/C/D-like domain-containing protein n=1 Tax=candidate division LCP-89 bacterium B3_LCP TaxID=2012998 RepID=A0A532V3P5_UNCL8|nr:MAG: hypothetical protein CEE37_03360 [candidate division LCP-89 bacterium B3_LCP]